MLYKHLNNLLTYFIPFGVILYAIYNIIINGTIYAIARVPFTQEYVHSFSLICFVTSYIVFMKVLIHIPIVARTIISFLLIAFHGYFGGFVWDFNNLIVNKIYNVMILIDVTVCVWIFVCLLYLNKKYLILKKNPSINDKIYTGALFLAQSYGYVLLYISGFWRYFAIGAVIDIPDPNANLNWLFMRITTFFLLYFLLERGKEENTSLEAPKLI